MSSKRVWVSLREKRPFRDGFTTGWRAGGALGEALGAVFSGLRSVLFPPARARSLSRDTEARATTALLAEVSELWANSPLGVNEPPEVVGVLLSGVLQGADSPPSEEVLDALYYAIAQFMVAEGLWEIPSPDVISELSLEDGVELRELLRHQREFLANFDGTFDLWARHLVATLVAILDALPALPETEDERGGQRLQANLVDLATNAPELIETLTLCFSDDDLIAHDLFRDVRKQLYFNLLSASGIEPDRVESTTKQAVLPTAVRGVSALNLARDYLHDTPYLPLFRLRLGFSVPAETRFEHTHILGGTGHGKTQLLKLLAYEDIRQSAEDGRSVVVLDSQGDLVTTLAHLKEFTPGSPLSDRFVLVDPTDTEFPVCLNLFAMHGERPDLSGAEREQLFNATVALYEYMFGALLGAELTQRQGVIFKYLARLMMVIPNATIHTFRELMQDAEPYRQYVASLDGTARAFFETQFFSKTFYPTKKQILTRLWGVLSNQTFDRMFSHSENKVDLFEAMNSGKIVLINTAKDLLQKDGCGIFGRFFIALVTQAALARAAIPAEKRRPCFVYVDEAHEYFDEHTEDLLNQARKYRVGMVLAHQNLDQLGLKLRATVMASTSVKLAGGVSSKDATALGREMNTSPELITSTRKRKHQTEFACFVRNLTSQPITVTVPLGAVDRRAKLTDREYENLISANRHRVALPASYVAPPPAPRPSRPEEDTDGESVSVSSATATPPPATEKAPKSSRPRAGHAVDKPSPPAPPTALGRGGKQHKYLQGLIKQMAEAQGFRATIEEPVDGGAGSVDVSLAKDDLTVACEISVTTSPEHELQNVEKCLAAGYQQVMVVATERSGLSKLQSAIQSGLDDADVSRVAFLAPDDCPAFLAALSPSAPAAPTVRGYKVKLNYQASSEAEQKRRRAAIGKVIAGSMKRLT